MIAMTTSNSISVNARFSQNGLFMDVSLKLRTNGQRSHGPFTSTRRPRGPRGAVESKAEDIPRPTFFAGVLAS